MTSTRPKKTIALFNFNKPVFKKKKSKSGNAAKPPQKSRVQPTPDFGATNVPDSISVDDVEELDEANLLQLEEDLSIWGEGLPTPLPGIEELEVNDARIPSSSSPTPSAEILDFPVSATKQDTVRPSPKGQATVPPPKQPVKWPQKVIFTLLRIGIFGVGISVVAGSTLARIDYNNPPLRKQWNWLTTSVTQTGNAITESAAGAYNGALPLLEKLPGDWTLPRINQDAQPAAEETIIAAKPEQSTATGAAPKVSTTDKRTLIATRELNSLKEKLNVIAAEYPDLDAGAYFLDLDNGAYVNRAGSQPFPAASTIKIPILIAYLEALDEGKVFLDQPLTQKQELIGGGSGEMQGYPAGTKFSSLDTITKMIIISDNTATNLVIDKLGGPDAVNARFQTWGLKHTKINNLLPDLEGTNTTSPQDLALLLGKVAQGEILSLSSRDRLLQIMRRTKTRTLLPQGLESDAVIANKTGDIGFIIGDAGIIEMPTGKRYVAAVITHRPYNDVRGRVMIQKMSRAGYQHFKHYEPRPFTAE
ncbi:MAG: serine hydrolase [Cyanobacteria bacterium P01_H01_bin.15]